VTALRRLDHVGIVVESIETAIEYYSAKLGLEVAVSELLESPPVRLAYLDAGNAFVQLIEPRDPTSELARWLRTHGEGIHHICFGVDDVPGAVTSLDGAPPVALGSGRGRVSAFFSAPARHGVLIECTEFDRVKDVVETPGWLDCSGS
jgi:methylmalonyl-CoA epimerase